MPINLNFTVSYTVPDSGAIVLVFGEIEGISAVFPHSVELPLVVPHLIINVKDKAIVSDGVMFGVSVSTGMVGIILGVDHDVVSLALDSPVHVISGGQAHNLPNRLTTPGHSLLWGETTDFLDSQKSFLFEEGLITDNQQSIPFEEAEDVSSSFVSSFRNALPFIDEQEHIPWGDFENQIDSDYKFDYRGILPFLDHHYTFPWDKFTYLQNDFVSKFRSPGKKDNHFIFPFQVFAGFVDYSQFILYGDSVNVDVSNIQYTGPKWYSLICGRKYFPFQSGSIVLSFTSDRPNSVFGDPAVDPLNFSEVYRTVCPYSHWHSGIRDRYEEEIIVIPIPKIKEYYYMLNTITLKRLPDNTILDCYDVNIQTDIDSWTWDFTITLPKQSYLDLVKPSLAGSDLVLIDIEVMINSWKWTCRVESWSESVSFGNKSWTIRGRSPSIQLASPYALPGVITNPSLTQGADLIDDILEGSGWGVEWGFANSALTFSDYLNPSIDWAIPAGAFNSVDKTRLQAMQDVLKAIDARIITKPDCYTDKNFIVIPRYSITPWGWAAATADHSFNSIVCWEFSRQYESLPKINAVVVSGQNQGVVVNATRDGTAGDKAATMVTDPLITTSSSGGERAKNVLSKEGMWTNHSLKLFSLDDQVSPTGDYPGLILPGKLVAITEGSLTWKGQVTSTAIHGQSVSSSRGIEVTQTIGVEEYNG